MNKLLKDAIADAKAVRETALANAKVALEEAFAPKLQSMLSHKIKEEMMDDTEVEEDGREVEKSEDEKQVEEMQKMAGITSEEDEEGNMEDGEDMDVDSEDEIDMDSQDDMDVDSQDDMDMDSQDDMDVDSEEEVSDEELEEILRELDSEVGEESEVEVSDEETEGMNYEGKMSNDEDEEINLEEIIAALREEDEVDAPKEEEEEEEVDPKASEELEEAYGVIKYLRTKINEVNLLNAKLLYVNKLFRKGELTETQKVKIIETFDRAKNVREAKLIYATLAESVSAKKTKTTVAPKRKMNEGFASAPSKKTQIISESNGVYSRFKTLVEYNNKK